MSEKHEPHFFDAEIYQEDTLDDVIHYFLSCNNFSAKREEPEHRLLETIFNFLPVNLIKNASKLSTQHARATESSMLKKTCPSHFTALKVKLRHALVSTDTLCSDTPAIGDGSTCSQLL